MFPLREWSDVHLTGTHSLNALYGHKRYTRTGWLSVSWTVPSLQDAGFTKMAEEVGVCISLLSKFGRE